jgi:hypothetical protein
MNAHQSNTLPLPIPRGDLDPDRGDLPYICDLQDKHKNAVGFLTPGAINEYFNRRQIIVARENGDPSGYLLFGSNRRRTLVSQPDCMKIIVACIQYDARRVHHATRLVNWLVNHSLYRQLDRVSLWCASDLDANRFWKALGFTHVGNRTRVLARGKSRMHCQWTLQLSNPFQQRLFGPSSLDPQEITVHRQETLA